MSYTCFLVLQRARARLKVSEKSAHRGCCYGVYSLTKAVFSGTVVNLRSLFRGRKLQSYFKVGQAVPLGVGCKLELLLRAVVVPKFPYTSPYTHAFVRICILPSI